MGWNLTRNQVAGKPLDVVAWDLPGAGTPNFPQATYLKQMGIRYFDVAILVTSSRFTEAELMLAQELQKFEVPFFMVRNKVDVDIESEIVKEEESLDDDDGEEHELTKPQRAAVAKQTIQCIKDYFNLEYGIDKVYCVSARRKLRKDYDFPSLEHDILEAVRRQRVWMKRRTLPLNITFVDLDLGDPPGDEKREGVFFSQKGTPCSRYMHSSQKIIKTKSWKLEFCCVRRFPIPHPPKKGNTKKFLSNFFDANFFSVGLLFLAVRHSEARGEEHVGVA